MSEQESFISQKDLPLYIPQRCLITTAAHIEAGMENREATFDLYVRELPEHRNYLIFAGLEDIVNYLINLRFTEEQVLWLKGYFPFSQKILDYFRDFRFTGDLSAMKEGTIFFPNEPVIRITAPIVEAQLIEMYLINTAFLQTILASKISRFIKAAEGKEVAIGYNRTYGTDAAMKAVRIQMILGVTCSLPSWHYKHASTSTFSAGTFHYLISAFDREIDAFRAYLKHMKGKGYVLVDTYHSVKGIRNYITAAKEFEKEGLKVTGIQLDSGDLLDLSRKARRLFDKAGLTHAKIFAMSNLDEYKVEKLVKAKAPIDVYAGTTNIINPLDAPVIEVVYKLSEMQKGNKVLPKMKTSTKKISLPGRKQVFRNFNGSNYINDTIGLEDENISGEKLLRPIIQNGKLVSELPNLEGIRKYYQSQLPKFKENIFHLNQKIIYPVKISPRLKELVQQTRKEIRKNM